MFHVTLKTGVMMINSPLITRIKYILKYIQKENIIFHYITVFFLYQINAALVSRRGFF